MKSPRLVLDFAPGAKRRDWRGVSALVASVCVFGAVGYRVSDVLALRAHDAQALAELEASAHRPPPAATQPTDRGELLRVNAARKVAQNLMTPWAQLLASLETAPTRTIALISVEPSVSQRTLHLTAEARNAGDMLDYLAALQHDARLSEAVLLSHEVQKSPGAPVRFRIEATWGSEP